MDGISAGGASGESVSIAERHFARGAELVRAGRYREAVEPLEKALSCLVGQPEPPFLVPLRSFYGTALAHGRGDVDRGRRLCEESVYLEPDAAELYANLGLVFVKARRRELAVAAADTALAIEPSLPSAGRIIRDLGLRRPPVFPFLDRGHPINKYVGLIRHRFLS